MSSKEVLGTPPDFDWEPSIAVRAHHVKTYAGSKLRNTLRLYNPINITRAMIATLKDSRDSESYGRDTVGIFGTPEYQKNEQAVKQFENELKNLPDETVVRIDLAKDRICDACVVGKHCTATNYDHHGRKVDAATLDEGQLNELHRRLLKKGFSQETDFKLLPTTQEFLDYQGEDLWRNSQPPIPRVVEYSAMLVRMGALRRVI